MSPLVNHGMIGSAMIWEHGETTEQKKHMFYDKNGIIEAVQKRKVEVGDTYTLVRMYYQNKTFPDPRKFVSYMKGKWCLFNC